MTLLYLLGDPTLGSNAGDLFNRILQNARGSEFIGEYQLAGFSSENITFRYFDTFDGVLTSRNIFNYIRPVTPLFDSPPKVQEYGYVYTVEFPEGRIKSEDIQQLFIPHGTDFYQLSPYDFKYWGPLNRVKQAGRNALLQEQLRLEVNYTHFNLRRKKEVKSPSSLPRDKSSKITEEKSESDVVVSLEKVLVTGNFNISTTLYQLSFKTSDDNDKSLSSIFDFFIGKDFSYFYLAPDPIWVKARDLITGKEIYKNPVKEILKLPVT